MDFWQWFLHSEFTHFMLTGAYIIVVGTLESPTKDSPQWYKSLFALLNFFSLQFSRMSPKIEKSPNFQDAVNIQAQAAGLPPIAVKPITEVKS